MRVGHCAVCPSDRWYLEGGKNLQALSAESVAIHWPPSFPALRVRQEPVDSLWWGDPLLPHKKTHTKKRGLKSIFKQTQRFSHVLSSATWGVSLVNHSALRLNAKSTHTTKLKEKSVSCETKTQHSPVIPNGLCCHIFLNAVKLVKHAGQQQRTKGRSVPVKK